MGFQEVKKNQNNNTWELSVFQEWLPETGIDARSTQSSTSKSQMQWQKSCQFLLTFQSVPQLSPAAAESAQHWHGPPHASVPYHCYWWHMYLSIYPQYLKVQLLTWLHHHHWRTKPQCTTYKMGMQVFTSITNLYCILKIHIVSFLTKSKIRWYKYYSLKQCNQIAEFLVNYVDSTWSDVYIFIY